MDADDLLKAVAATLREEEEASPFDARWDALAKGRLPSDEVAGLHTESEKSATARWGMAAFSPLSGETRDRIQARLTAELDASDTEAEADPVKDRGTGALSFLPRLIRRRPFVSVAVPTIPLMALAACLVLLLPTPGMRDSNPLPSYVLELVGGARVLRGEAEPTPNQPPRFGPTSWIEMTLRPTTPVDAEVDMAIFLVRGDTVRTTDFPIARSTSGTFHFEGLAHDLFKAPAGAWELVLLVGRPASLQADPDEVAQLVWQHTDTPDGDWQLIRRPIVLTKAHSIDSL